MNLAKFSKPPLALSSRVTHYLHSSFQYFGNFPSLKFAQFCCWHLRPKTHLSFSQYFHLPMTQFSYTILNCKDFTIYHVCFFKKLFFYRRFMSPKAFKHCHVSCIMCHVSGSICLNFLTKWWR